MRQKCKPWIYTYDGNNQGWQKLDGSGLETKWGRDFKAPVQRGPNKPTHPLVQLVLDSFPGVRVAGGGFKSPHVI
jgi:hypothetical protein